MGFTICPSMHTEIFGLINNAAYNHDVDSKSTCLSENDPCFFVELSMNFFMELVSGRITKIKTSSEGNLCILQKRSLLNELTFPRE